MTPSEGRDVSPVIKRKENRRSGALEELGKGRMRNWEKSELERGWDP